jgi:hypothetical protein
MTTSPTLAFDRANEAFTTFARVDVSPRERDHRESIGAEHTRETRARRALPTPEPDAVERLAPQKRPQPR